VEHRPTINGGKPLNSWGRKPEVYNDWPPSIHTDSSIPGRASIPCRKRPGIPFLDRMSMPSRSRCAAG
jgi:hypothetical protein